VLVAVVLLVGDGGVGDVGGRIEHAEAHPGPEQATDAEIYISLGEDPLRDGARQVAVAAAAVEVAAGLDREGGRLLEGLRANAPSNVLHAQRR
jgi:hypothetical protein